MNERKIRNLIIVDDYISPMMQNHMTAAGEPGVVDVHAFLHFMESMRSINTQELARKLGIADDNIPLLYVSGMLLQCIIRMMNCELLWAPGVTLCDGIVYDYAVQHRYLQPAHDFEEDIVACARNIAKRYMGLPERGSVIENISLKIFDETRKYHGMGQRERLLLRIAALLHDCGKYISMVNAGECAYNIIMSTEIIGLSHIEREIVANVVKYNHSTFEYYGMKKSTTDLDREAYIVITKLTAILRIANGLDRSHTQKCNDVRISVRDLNMIITVNTSQDLTMEKGLFVHRADFFEEVFGIRPVIKRKK
jgi:exopolyphosphatase/guanosine-5'-triphosphate,3'-diphosphate pyrophosphatase